MISQIEKLKGGESNGQEEKPQEGLHVGRVAAGAISPAAKIHTPHSTWGTRDPDSIVPKKIGRTPIPPRPITIHKDEKGEFGLVPLSDGKYAMIDKADIAIIGKHSWSFSGGYAVRCKRGVTIRMHRLIAGTPAGMETDHIDGNTLNNRRYNLRHATSSQNKHNRPKTKRNTTGFKGVTFQCGKFVAQICINRKYTYLGRFTTAELARKAYCDAALLVHKEFAKTQ